MRSQALTRLGKNDEALADVETLLKLRPDLPPALRTRAVIEASQGKTDEAIADLQKVCQQEPEDLECRFQLALLYRTKKDLAKAFETFDAALAIDANNWFLRYGRADLYLSVGKHAEAVKDYEIAFESQPDESGLLNNFAWLLATSPDDKVRNGRRAIKLATKACELTDHKMPHILSTLAAAYAETGDFESARRWSKKAVEIATEENREQLSKELASYEGSHAWRELLNEEQENKATPSTADKSGKQDSDEAASAQKPAPVGTADQWGGTGFANVLSSDQLVVEAFAKKSAGSVGRQPLHRLVFEPSSSTARAKPVAPEKVQAAAGPKGRATVQSRGSSSSG